VKAWRLVSVEEGPFAAQKEIVAAKLIMVIPITKQRLINCHSFIRSGFNSLLFMVVSLLRQ